VSESQVSGPENPDTGLWGVSEVSETSEQEPTEGDDQ
jgi:hypothetical protein